MSRPRMRTRMHTDRGLYAIADAGTVSAKRLPALSARVLAGGAVMLQYRDKINAPSVRERCALALRDACRRWRVPFLVNDDPALAARIRADGAHLGRADPGLAEARALLGAGAIIGISCYDSLERALQAQAAGADYVAFGSCYPSATKPGAVRATPALLRRARRTLAIPIAAIGGIAAENAAEPLRAGAGLLEWRVERFDKAIALSTIYAATRMDVAVIAALTESGSTALWMSRLDSPVPIYAVTPHIETCRKVTLYRGVYPVLVERTGQRVQVKEEVVAALQRCRAVGAGDCVIVTRGDTVGKHGGTNTMKIITVP